MHRVKTDLCREWRGGMRRGSVTRRGEGRKNLSLQKRAEGAAEAEAHTWHTGKNTWIFYGLLVRSFAACLVCSLKLLWLILKFIGSVKKIKFWNSINQGNVLVAHFFFFSFVCLFVFSPRSVSAFFSKGLSWPASFTLITLTEWLHC